MAEYNNSDYLKGVQDTIEKFLNEEKRCHEEGGECEYWNDGDYTCVMCIADRLKEKRNDLLRM